MRYYPQQNWRYSENPLLRWLGGLPAGVGFLILANAAVFVLQILLSILVPSAAAYFPWIFGFSVRLGLKHGFVWQFLTYMFVHGGLFHIFMNMFTLWMFGRRLEDRWGTTEFLRYYIVVCGFGAVVVHALATIFLGQPDMPIIGASGAVYGLLLAAALYWGDETVYLNFIIPMKLKYVVLLIGFLDFTSSVGQVTGGGGSNVAHFAHLGGLLTGYLYLRAGGWTLLRGIFFRGPRRPVRVQKPPRQRFRRPSLDEDTWR